MLGISASSERQVSLRDVTYIRISTESSKITEWQKIDAYQDLVQNLQHLTVDLRNSPFIRDLPLAAVGFSYFDLTPAAIWLHHLLP